MHPKIFRENRTPGSRKKAIQFAPLILRIHTLSTRNEYSLCRLFSAYTHHTSSAPPRVLPSKRHAPFLAGGVRGFVHWALGRTCEAESGRGRKKRVENSTPPPPGGGGREIQKPPYHLLPPPRWSASPTPLTTSQIEEKYARVVDNSVRFRFAAQQGNSLPNATQFNSINQNIM